LPREQRSDQHALTTSITARLYFEGMETIIKELNLNMDAQLASFRQHSKAPQVRIITLDGSDIGWLQNSHLSASIPPSLQPCTQCRAKLHAVEAAAKMTRYSPQRSAQ
jgi:hypothetical protein